MALEKPRIGHFERRLPEGYVASLKRLAARVPHSPLAPSENELVNPALARPYGRLRLLTQAPLLAPGRLAAIAELNLRYRPPNCDSPRCLRIEQLPKREATSGEAVPPARVIGMRRSGRWIEIDVGGLREPVRIRAEWLLDSNPQAVSGVTRFDQTGQASGAGAIGAVVAVDFGSRSAARQDWQNGVCLGWRPGRGAAELLAGQPRCEEGIASTQRRSR